MMTYGMDSDNLNNALTAAIRTGSAPWATINATEGEGVGYVASYSDVRPFCITRRTETRVWARPARAALLNGPESGAEDQLVSSPGGFAANVQGRQRWAFFVPADASEEVEFSLRKSGRFVLRGIPDQGTSGCTLVIGELRAFYDFNF
jgi:hypothetical protein